MHGCVQILFFCLLTTEYTEFHRVFFFLRMILTPLLSFRRLKGGRISSA